MLLIVSFLIIGILASSHILTVTPTKTPEIKGESTSVITANTPPPTQLPESTTPTSVIKIEITHSPTQSQQNPNTNFTYPNSSTLGEGLYESSDDPKVITQWYKEKINSENMNVTSFVTTDTNDNIKNVLAFANEEKNMQIEITKKSGDTKTKIRIQ